MRYADKQIKEQAENLKRWLHPGDTVYAIIDQVSTSGMSRHLRLYCLTTWNGRPYMQHITYSVAVLLGYKLLDTPGHQNCIRVNGCGMDMAWDTVSRVAESLFGDYQALKSEIL